MYDTRIPVIFKMTICNISFVYIINILKIGKIFNYRKRQVLYIRLNYLSQMSVPIYRYRQKYFYL